MKSLPLPPKVIHLKNKVGHARDYFWSSLTSSFVPSNSYNPSQSENCHRTTHTKGEGKQEDHLKILVLRRALKELQVSI